MRHVKFLTPTEFLGTVFDVFNRDIDWNLNWLYITGELCVTRQVFDAYRVSSHLDNIRLRDGLTYIILIVHNYANLVDYWEFIYTLSLRLPRKYLKPCSVYSFQRHRQN